MSRKQLAKKIRISPQRLHYKLQNLTKELIDPIVLINYQLIGVKTYLLFVQRLSEEQKDQLMKDPSVGFFMQTIGSYQYVINVITQDIDDFCKRLLPESSLDIIEVIKQIPDAYDPFSIGKNLEVIKKDRKIKLDKKDFLILSQLSKKPDDSLLNTSKMGIDRQTIKKRIKNMEEANIIQKFRYSMNISKLGYLMYFLKIETTPSIRDKIVSEIRRDNYSGMIFMGNNELFIFYLPPSHKELFKLIERIQTKEANIKIDIMQSTEYFRIDPSPSKILEELYNKA